MIDDTYYDDQTLLTIYNTLQDKLGYATNEVSEIIYELEEAGILFRERVG